MTPFDLVVGRWGARFLNRRFPCTIGRGGIVAPHLKREGDGATPAGVHRFTGMLYRPDRLTPPADWALPFGPGDLWSDDPGDPDYNLMGQKPYVFGHERLTRPDPMYDLILTTDWNWPDAIPGRGSAIFVHTWRGPHHPTAGCVAFARAHLCWIAARLRHASRLVIRA